MKRVLILSLESISNGGDQMLGDTTEWIIRKEYCDCEIVRKELMPKYNELGFRGCLGVAICLLSKYLVGNIRHKIFDLGSRIKYGKYIRTLINDVDAIVYAVGMMKFSTQNFSHVFSMINTIATKLNIPVLMNAMSIEKPNDKDWRYNQLVNAVNLSAVKIITTRDGKDGLDRLRTYYIKRDDIITDYVGDPALWASSCYRVERNNSPKDKLTLGIGLIRPTIYSDYEGGVSAERLVDFYKSLISEVIRHNEYDFCLFCNGMDCDYKLGEKLLVDLNLPQEKLLPRPETAEKLTMLISRFDLVFGARLHACITSVSLGIPVSGLLWDNKLKFFSETMGIDRFFSASNELDGKIVYQKLKDAYNNPINIENRESYKFKTVEYINKFFS